MQHLIAMMHRKGPIQEEMLSKQESFKINMHTSHMCVILLTATLLRPSIIANSDIKSRFSFALKLKTLSQ